jgi:hypothetical protein
MTFQLTYSVIRDRRSLFWKVGISVIVTYELTVPSWSCSKAVYKPVWHIPLLSVQWINSWRWTDELSETCRVSWRNKFVKLVHLFGVITKKFVTMRHGHMLQCTVTCYDAARSHVTMHGHMLQCTVTCYNARSHVTMRHGHVLQCMVTWT